MNESNDKLLELKALKLRFGDKVILDGVDLSLKPQEILVIMGLSGGGKSTLLNILLGLQPVDDGSVRFKKEDVAKVPRPELNRIRTKIGMVFQNAALVSSMSVRDNIALPLRELSDKNDKDIDSIVNEKLKMVGLAEAKEKLPSELSGGMKKRVGLARALALDPELILFDEPTAGLDPISGRHIDDLIVGLRNDHKATSIVVTHELDSAFTVATRMAFLHEGKIIVDGTPDEFRKSDNKTVKEFLTAYSNSPQERS